MFLGHENVLTVLFTHKVTYIYFKKCLDSIAVKNWVYYNLRTRMESKYKLYDSLRQPVQV